MSTPSGLRSRLWPPEAFHPPNRMPLLVASCWDRNSTYLTIFSSSLSARLYLQALVVHLMHVSCGLHITKDVILQLWDRLQRIRDILILLNITNHLGCLRPFGEVNHVGLLDDRWYAILDECQVGQVYT